MKKNLLIIGLCILICLLVGALGSYIQMDGLIHWYPNLRKSVLTPPGYVFPIVWTLLYICMGISIGLVLIKDPLEKANLAKVFVVQLFFNLTWSFSFFYLESPLLALVNILILLLFIIIYTVISYKAVRISSYLFMPYLVWVAFATYLTYYVYQYN